MTTTTAAVAAPAAAKPVAKPSPAAVKAAVKRMAEETLAKGTLVPPAEEAKPAKAPKAKPVPAAACYLMFIGETFYTKDSYCEEAALLGISKRMPSYRLPADLKVGESKVYLVAGGKRKTKLTEGETITAADIFGSFIPEAIEFIAGEDGEAGVYADICAYAKTRVADGWRVVTKVVHEAKRLCGHRKVGGTYLVTTKREDAISPITMLAKPAPFKGNHFRGMMRLTAEQVAAIEAGEGLDRLTTVKCECCGEDMLVSPDSVARKAREDRREERGEARKWRIMCRPCATKAREEAKAAAEAGTAEAPVEAEVAESTIEGVDATAAS